MLKFTVITIEKNYHDGLLSTLQTLSNQIIPNGMSFSHLICEGTPGTARDLIRELNLKELSKICSSSDSGLYNGMNRGLDHVIEGWVLFLNAGDTLIGSESLSHIYDVLKTATSPIVQFKSNYSDGTQRPFKPYSRISLFLGRNMHIHPALCINLDIVGKIRFDESFQIAADYKMVIELLHHFKLQFSDVVVSNFEGGGISSRSVEILTEEMGLVRTLVSPKYFPVSLVKLWNLYFSHRVRKRMRVD